jgi:preprotein translocase subunit SecB
MIVLTLMLCLAVPVWAADESGNTAPASAASQAQSLAVNLQYVKNLSFAEPGAPQIFKLLQDQPDLLSNVDVTAERIKQGQNSFEVSLHVHAEAHLGGNQHQPNDIGSAQSATLESTIFVIDLIYAGVFTLQGVADDAMEPILLVECPHILFPFARAIIANVSRDGGLPTVLMPTIDFEALLQTKHSTMK